MGPLGQGVGTPELRADGNLLNLHPHFPLWVPSTLLSPQPLLVGCCFPNSADNVQEL